MKLRPALVWLRHEAAWQDGIYRDLVHSPVGGNRAGELEHRRFRCLVMPPRDTAAGNKSIDRRDIDDASAPTALDHRGAEPFCTKHATREIQIDQFTPLVEPH